MTPEERIAVLETKVETLTVSINEMGTDVRTIRDTLLQATGGWKLFLFVGGAGAAIGAFLMKILPYLGGKIPT